jgi:hypothetical protein
VRRKGFVLLVVAALLAVAAATVPGGGGPASAKTRAPRIAAVGDIACKDPPKNNRKVCQYDDVARAIAKGNYDRFLVLGDVQYEYGEYTNFVQNYDRYFGRFLPISEPVPGNHDYGTPGARGYYRYFSQIGQVADGYYSYGLGSWHIVALNSAICPPTTGCAPGDPQYDWLVKDLADHPAECTLAYWHHPRFDWLKYQNADWTESYEWLRSKPFWDALYAAGADVVLAGHNHNYSRWLPMNARGRFDPQHGLTQFIVGTGGRNLNGFGSPSTRPKTFVTGWAGGFGFLQMRLRSGGYDWKFVPTNPDANFIDQGSASCH